MEKRKKPSECLNPYDWANCDTPPWPDAPTFAGRVGQLLGAFLILAALFAFCVWVATP